MWGVFQPQGTVNARPWGELFKEISSRKGRRGRVGGGKAEGKQGPYQTAEWAREKGASILLGPSIQGRGPPKELAFEMRLKECRNLPTPPAENLSPSSHRKLKATWTLGSQTSTGCASMAVANWLGPLFSSPKTSALLTSSSYLHLQTIPAPPSQMAPSGLYLYSPAWLDTIPLHPQFPEQSLAQCRSLVSK